MLQDYVREIARKMRSHAAQCDAEQPRGAAVAAQLESYAEQLEAGLLKGRHADRANEQHPPDQVAHDLRAAELQDDLRAAEAFLDASRESHAALQKFLRTLRDAMAAEADSLRKENKRDRARCLREYIRHIESVTGRG